MTVDTGEPIELPIPDFYRAANAERWNYRPDQEATFRAADAWRRDHGLAPAAEDEVTVRVQLTDCQRDFCFPEGSLYVGGRSGRGALEDNDRTARFIYRNLGILTEVACTLDTHFPHQIFFPSFWLTEENRPPEPNREVSLEEIRSGSIRPNPALATWYADGDAEWLSRYVEHYCRELEREEKYTLYLWPPHCLLGSEGHTLAGVIHEARLFHAFAREARDWVEVKGGNPLTEHYSALSPEVVTSHTGDRIAEPDSRYAELLLESDAVLIAGQAASHCVRYTIEDLLSEIRRRDESLADKVYILEDCTSSVAIPDPDRPGEFLADFTDRTEEAFERFAEAGIHLVRSTTPVAEWPGFPLGS